MMKDEGLRYRLSPMNLNKAIVCLCFFKAFLNPSAAGGHKNLSSFIFHYSSLKNISGFIDSLNLFALHGGFCYQKIIFAKAVDILLLKRYNKFSCTIVC